MAINFNFQNSTGCGGCGGGNECPDQYGCPPDRCPDFTIRRHDTRPPFKVAVEDCDGPMDIQGLVIEVNMWALAKLKKSITVEDTYFALADNIGFNQVMVGDIIVMDRVRLPEYMLVTGFDEENNLLQVERGYRGTTPSKWKKGTPMRIFRIMNAPAQTELHFDDITYPDGTKELDKLVAALLVYEWSAPDTCLPGCYWLEFKIIKMQDIVLYLPGGHWTGPVTQNDNGFFYTGSEITNSSVKLSYDAVKDRYLLPSDAWVDDFHQHSGTYYTGQVHNDGSVYLNHTDVPSDADVPYKNVDLEEENVTVESLATSISPSFVPSFTPSEATNNATVASYFGCILGDGVEWMRRMPLSGEGFLIKITDSPTREW